MLATPLVPCVMKLQILPTHKPLSGWLTSSRCDGSGSSEEDPNILCCVSELWEASVKSKVRLAQGRVKVGLEWFVSQPTSGSSNKIPVCISHMACLVLLTD